MSATHLESKTVNIPKGDKELFEFLLNAENFGSFMPASVSSFKADGDSFTFGMKGMPEVRLKFKDSEEYSRIRLESASGKIDFVLSALISGNGETSSQLQFVFDGNFNPMLKMMVERPLKAFIEDLAENIAKL